MLGFGRKNKKGHEIYPDEVFLDARNLPEFDTHQMQGRLERPITKYAVLAIGALFLLAGFAFLGRAAYLQIAEGAYFSNRAASNHLRHVPIFAERGVIYDRNGTELVWNEDNPDEEFANRAYAPLDGLAHVLGYVSYPKRDKQGVYYQMEIKGKDGVELTYDEELAGAGGVVIKEIDARGNTQTQNVLDTPRDGANIHLAIDAEVQNKLFAAIRSLAHTSDFQAGAGVIMNVSNGEILALTSFPEYGPAIMSAGEPEERINQWVRNESNPFLNRVVAGRYTPGSTVKPFFGIAALEEHIIDPLKEILSTGSVAVPNPYDPDRETVFNDWKAHGWVDLRDALAVSSNVYFYTVGGGLPPEEATRVGYGKEEGLGIDRLEEYARAFGLGRKTGIDLPAEKSGVIPNPEWKADHFEDDQWRIGDTYNTAIGQYGFQITPIELARAVSAVANGGTLVKPHLLLRIENSPSYDEGVVAGTIDIDPQNAQVVREGMRQGVTSGIATALNIEGVQVAAKTGTAEIGITDKRIHSWISGFFPYENPRYAFAVVMEEGPYDNLQGAVFAIRELLVWMRNEKPEYIEG